MKRKALALTFILALLFSAAAGMLLVNSAKANGFLIYEKLPVNQAHIRSDGSIDPPTMPIERVGNLYVLTDDILNCTILIERDNIEIDGNGFLMSLPSYGEKDADGKVKYAPALIGMFQRTNITVRNFHFHHADKVINLTNSSDITIVDNRITQCTMGIDLYTSSTHCSVIGNKLENNVCGISGWRSDNHLIKYNQLSHCSEGILAYLSNSSIIGNIFIGCGTAIKYLESHNLVIGNTFQENTNGISTIRPDNEIHHNNFIDNTEDYYATMNYSTLFDDGKEGNYWSDYKGIDVNGDGVGDSPYLIERVYKIVDRVFVNQYGKDNYPLTSPYIFNYVSPIISIVSPKSRTYINGDVAIIFNSSKETPRASYSINGSKRVPLQEDTVLTALSKGTYSLTVYAEDVFGNEGTATVTFTIGATDDLLTGATDDLLTATLTIAVAIVAVGLIVYFKKRNHAKANKHSETAQSPS
jgi:parallel beta-helix repeat protein